MKKELLKPSKLNIQTPKPEKIPLIIEISSSNSNEEQKTIINTPQKNYTQEKKLKIQKVLSSSEKTPEDDAVGKTKHSPKYTPKIVKIKPSNKKEKSHVKISENLENHYPIKVIQKKDIFSQTGDECVKSIPDF